MIQIYIKNDSILKSKPDHTHSLDAYYQVELQKVHAYAKLYFDKLDMVFKDTSSTVTLRVSTANIFGEVINVNAEAKNCREVNFQEKVVLKTATPELLRSTDEEDQEIGQEDEVDGNIPIASPESKDFDMNIPIKKKISLLEQHLRGGYFSMILLGIKWLYLRQFLGLFRL